MCHVGVLWYFWHRCRSFGEKACLLSRFHSVLSLLFKLGHFAYRNLPWQDLCIYWYACCQFTSFLFVSILVLLVLVCIKRDLWNRMIKSRFCDRWDREGLFEQEERFDRKRKHKKKLGNKAQKFAEKYQLNDSSTFLYSP